MGEASLVGLHSNPSSFISASVNGANTSGVKESLPFRAPGLRGPVAWNTGTKPTTGLEARVMTISSPAHAFAINRESRALARLMVTVSMP